MRVRRLIISSFAFGLAAGDVAFATTAEDVQAAHARGDYAGEVGMLRPRAEAGDSEAQRELGNHFRAGLGVPQDLGESVRWYRLAAEQGNAQAQSALGASYDEGSGVTQDFEQAAQWYRRAAYQYVADAQFALGELYRLGRGVPGDDILAYMWFTVAIQNAESYIAEGYRASRDDLARTMRPDQIAEGERLAREWRPD